MMTKIETNVYVDGFNLYHGCVEGTPYRWLNLSKLCSLLLPGHSINRIRYFTTLVEPDSNDTHKQRRQLTYIRALQTIPNLSWHRGEFKKRNKWRPLVNPPKRGSRWVYVKDRVEKRSDVNLATYLLVDGFKKEYQMAVVISNDADLAEAIKLVRSELDLRVGILHPYRDVHVVELSDIAEFYRVIRERALRASQFPPVLKDAYGTITKPPEW